MGPGPEAAQVLIGLDVGTTGVKAVAISPDGRMLGSVTEEYALSTPQPGWAEQDPEDWWRAAQKCLERLPEGHVGFSGQMHGLVVLDAEERVLRPAILWNDQRTAAECAEIEARVGLDAVPGADIAVLQEGRVGAQARAYFQDVAPYPGANTRCPICLPVRRGCENI